MECEKCRDQIKPGEEREMHGRVLCEDCYMDALSPAPPATPGPSIRPSLFKRKPGRRLSSLQTKILEYLQESGGAEFPWIVERLQIKPADLERELAALRHMEKIRAELRRKEIYPVDFTNK